MKPEAKLMRIPLFRETTPADGIDFNLRDLTDWVWQHSKSEVKWLVLGMLAASSFSGLSSLTLLYASRFINEIGRGFDPHRLGRIGLIVFAILIAMSALRLITSTLGAFAATNIRRNLEVTFFAHLSRLPFHYLEVKSHGRITAALMTEVPMVSGIISLILRSFVRAPISIIFVIAVLLYNSPKIALVSLATLPLFFLGVSFFTRRIKAKTQLSFQNISRMYGRINESLGGIRVVRCLGLLEYFATRLQDLSRDIAKTTRQSSVISAIQQTLQELIGVAILVGFLAWIAYEVVKGRMQIGQALLVPAAFIYIRNEILSISGGYMNLQGIESAAQRLRELLLQEEEQKGGERFSGMLNSIRLQELNFSYINGSEVLNGINLELKPGRLAVIVGESGAGKSTLCDLCLRLRAPTAGKILYNELEIGRLEEDFLRNLTALVEQEPFLFEGTVRENLLLASPKASEAQLWEALAAARAADFVRALPQGLDADVGQRGVKLSVGEKQRLALARALVRKPSFLVLDEFTSSLDVENEAEIIDALLASASDTIILCATHRPSIVAKASEVYQLANKRLVRVDPSSIPWQPANKMD